MPRLGSGGEAPACQTHPGSRPCRARPLPSLSLSSPPALLPGALCPTQAVRPAPPNLLHLPALLVVDHFLNTPPPGSAPCCPAQTVRTPPLQCVLPLHNPRSLHFSSLPECVCAPARVYSLLPPHYRAPGPVCVSLCLCALLLAPPETTRS